MARRGTSKYNSVKQEEYVAKVYRGARSPSSGAAAHDYGDVRNEEELIECKYTGSKPPKFVAELEKIVKEAWAEGREPMLALRFAGCEGSLLADENGFIDLSVRRMSDDVARGERREST